MNVKARWDSSVNVTQMTFIITKNHGNSVNNSNGGTMLILGEFPMA